MVEEKILDPREAAEFLGINPRTLQKYANQGLVQRYRIGGSVRYKQSELIAALQPEAEKS